MQIDSNLSPVLHLGRQISYAEEAKNFDELPSFRDLPSELGGSEF